MNWLPYTRDPALSPFQPLEYDGCRILARAGYAALVAPRADRAGAEEPVAIALAEGGRADHPIFALADGGKAVVRLYLRGGAVRHLIRARHFGGHRALDELRATERARAAGVRVPKVLAAAEYQHRIGYTAQLATRWIDHGRHGEAWLREAAPGDRARMLEEAGRQIALMHEAGISHPDLNLRNLLVVEPPGAAEALVYLLDFNRAGIYPAAVPASRRARDLERLGRSARKLGLALEEEGGWSALRAGYGTAWPLRARG
jgi:3-deoxy-D-manno-octulosonic acid kinase